MEDDRSADRQALQELKANYFRFLDTKQWGAWRELFTDDLVFHIELAPGTPAENPSNTGDDFVEAVSVQLKDAVTVHQGHMPEHTFADDRNADGIWAMFDWVDSSGSGGGSMQGFGHYHEHYVKGDDGKWRISNLLLTRLRVDQTAGTGAIPPKVEPWKRPVNTHQG
jgi:SnoaL-like domain